VVSEETDPGVAGNGRLTALSSAVLVVLLFIEIATTPALSALVQPHVFIGVLLAGPLLVKLGSTGYRFFRYYAGAPAYVRKGPPRLTLRLLAPLLVVTTLALMGTGVALLVTGPDDPGPFVGLHNLTFVLWLPIFAIHVFAYVGRLPGLIAADRRGLRADVVPGRALRIDLNAGALLLGAILAIVALPAAAPWPSSVFVAQALPGPLIAGTVVMLVALLAVRPLRWS
jgi:hypothetical protein